MSATPEVTLTQALTATPARILMGGGKRVAFVSDRADAKTLQIWTMALAINPLSAIGQVDVIQVTIGAGDKAQPGWSPDGKWLLFTSTRDGNPELYIMISRGMSYILGCERPYARSHPKMRGFTTRIL
ncbi:MAG TPA: hypothetical protein VF326_07765 [Anaerolineaceae bacterium]